jgi:hypothetical protein
MSTPSMPEISTWTTIDHPNGIDTYINDIEGEQYIGTYQNSTWETELHGFLYDGGAYRSIAFPGAYDRTVPLGISQGRIVGFYSDIVDSELTFRGFVLDGSTYQHLDYPGSIETQPEAIDGNYIVGTYVEHDGTAHGFLYDGANWTTIDHPLTAQHTFAYGITGNHILGSYRNSTGNHGYMTTLPATGDYNHDGFVDAADYVHWRKTDGTQPSYDAWRTDFGATAGSTAGAVAHNNSQPVPEPPTLALLSLVFVIRLRLRALRPLLP